MTSEVMVSSGIACVVCEQARAQVYCKQDAAYLCLPCDEQVHSANALAACHHRISIACTDQARLDAPPAPHTDHLSLDERDFFTVPNVETSNASRPVYDDSLSFDAKNLLGKDFLSTDLDLEDLDPSWLDRLDVGIDRLPSDLLDNLVPESLPAAQQPAAITVPQISAAAEHSPMMVVDEDYSMLPPGPAEMPARPRFAPAKLEVHEQPVDVDAYIPISLRPIDEAALASRMQLRNEQLSRFREKKRNRHFKKTIRYASRKAYAEVRPRIKGRFARKDELDAMRANGELPPI